LAKREVALQTRLKEKLSRMEVLDKLPQIHEEWHREAYHEYQSKRLGREVRGAYIRVRTEEEAWAILRELKNGRNFATIAKEQSLDRETGKRGGIVEGFYSRAVVTRVLGKDLVDLPVGKVAGPLKRPNGYDIIKFVEERFVPFEQIADGIYRDIRGQKTDRLEKAFLERLRDSLHVQLLPEGFALLLEKAVENHPTLSPEESAVPVYRYDGGAVPLGTCLGAVHRMRARDTSVDSTWIKTTVDKHVLFDALLLAEAKRRKLDQEPEFTDWLRRKEEALIMERLHTLETMGEREATQEEIEQFYSEHRDQYTLPDVVYLTEILVPTKEQAHFLLAELRKGASMEDLAANYSIRPNARLSRGNLHIHSYEVPVYKELYHAAMEAQIGEVMGPIPIEKGYFPGGYALFKVLEKSTGRIAPLTDVRSKVILHVRYEKERRRFEAFLAKLKEKYRVRVFEENLTSLVLARQGDGSGRQPSVREHDDHQQQVKEDAGLPTKVVLLKVEGMTCDACAISVETALKSVEGVKEAKASYKKGEAEVEYIEEKVTVDQMIEAINKIGYKASKGG
jgi:copper chaperone CopZ/parvulin-like peptidyl-prolyl isomerase